MQREVEYVVDGCTVVDHALAGISGMRDRLAQWKPRVKRD